MPNYSQEVPENPFEKLMDLDVSPESVKTHLRIIYQAYLSSGLSDDERERDVSFSIYNAILDYVEVVREQKSVSQALQA